MTDSAPHRRPYPVRLDELNQWAADNHTTSDEARRRFVQFVVLECLSSANIAKSLAFKGGNALRFGFGYPRSTFDLDFTAVELADDRTTIYDVVDSAVRDGSSVFDIRCKVTSVHRNPSNPERSFPTYLVKVGYALPGDRTFADFLSNVNQPYPVIPIDISFNDVVCETVTVYYGDDDEAGIETCTLNDITAEKIRSILQQVVRNRTRPQDVYDIARIIKQDKDKLELYKVRAFVEQKCHVRDIVFSEFAFDEDTRSRAEYDYEELRNDLREEFIPFDEAWDSVVSLARELLALPPDRAESPGRD